MGTKESIENAKLLVEYNIMCLREVEQLQQEKQKLDDELRSVEMGGGYQGRYVLWLRIFGINKQIFSSLSN